MKYMKKRYISPAVELTEVNSQPLLYSSVPYTSEYEISNPDEVE